MNKHGRMDRINVIIIGSGIALAGGFIAVAIWFCKKTNNPIGLTQHAVVVAELPKQQQTPVMTNSERWKWRDYKGREREISISREVKYNGTRS